MSIQTAFPRPQRPSRLCVLLAGLAAGCSASSDGEPTRRANPAAEAPSNSADVPSSGDTGAPALPEFAGLPTGNVNATRDPAACVTGRAEAEVIRTAVDIVVLMDNSGSMGDEARSVEANLNLNFASVLRDSGVDYRMIVISRHRERDGLLDRTSVCIAAPLSGLTQCPAGAPAASERFFHYSVEIGSRDSLSVLLETFTGALPDDFDLAPNGWSVWLRPAAKKVFLEISDDNANTAASDFIASLTALGPDQFGDATQPNFVWHSIVGLAEKNVVTEPYLPGDPLVSGECSGNGNNVFNAGETYQELSRLTGGLRFPICQFQAYDAVFKTIADDLVSVSGLACGFAIPTPPAGQALELDKVAVSYAPGGAGPSQLLGQVTDRAKCQANAFVVDATGINLCPEACDAIRADPGAALDVLFTCESTLIVR